MTLLVVAKITLKMQYNLLALLVHRIKNVAFEAYYILLSTK